MTPSYQTLEPPSNSRRFTVFWGSGSVYREFLFSDDMADACIYLMNLPEFDFSSFIASASPPLINIGCGKDQTISKCVDIIKNIVKYNGDVKWDKEKPDGTPKKLLDTSLLTSLGWKPKVELVDGIHVAYEEYRNRIHKIN